MNKTAATNNDSNLKIEQTADLSFKRINKSKNL